VEVTNSWHSVWARSRASSSPGGWGWPDDHRPGQGGGLQPQHVLGLVVQQDGQVERAGRRRAASHRPGRRAAASTSAWVRVAPPCAAPAARHRRGQQPARRWSREGALHDLRGPAVLVSRDNIVISVTVAINPGHVYRRPECPRERSGSPKREESQRMEFGIFNAIRHPAPLTARPTGRRRSTTGSWTSGFSSAPRRRRDQGTPGPQNTTS